MNKPTVHYVLLVPIRDTVLYGEMGGTLRSMERMKLRLGVEVGHDGACL